MAMTNKERQKKWYLAHMNGFGGHARRELTMRRILDYLFEHGETRASDVYRAMSAHRDSKTWQWLMGEIYHNSTEGDTLAPVTQVGTGKHGDPVYLRTSEEWDETRNWDKEQEALDKPNEETF
jgi:hypothetical protein